MTKEAPPWDPATEPSFFELNPDVGHQGWVIPGHTAPDAAAGEPGGAEATAATPRRRSRKRPTTLNDQFNLTRWRDIKPGTAPNYCVKGLIPREGLVVVYGPPKCGKTFWTFDLVAHIALGWTYRGRRVEPGTVVYVACEGERGLAARKEAFQQTNLAESADPPFYLLTTRLNLPAQVDALIPDIAAQISPQARVGAIVLDTLNRSIGGSENRDEDMTAYIAAADALRERFRCAVIIIHHTGNDGSRPRGHTSLAGAVDAQIAVKRADGDIVATLEWMKDGPEGAVLRSRLKVIELGEDDHGEIISSCVIEDIETSAAQSSAATKKNGLARNGHLSPKDQIALDTLSRALDAHGKPAPPNNHIPASAIVVDVELCRRFYFAGTSANGQSENSRRRAWNRSLESLIAKKLIFLWDEMVGIL